MPRKANITWIALLATLLTLAGCGKDEPASSSGDGYTVAEYTVAVIYPLSDYGENGIRELTDWFGQKLARAQQGMERRIKINIEWHDEDLEDLNELASDLRLRPDVMAVIGPLTSAHADIVADKLRPYRKTLILPCATSAELVRSYAGMGFLWSLTETDITQCEVLLTRAKDLGARSVALLASTDIYGQTFIDWFAFQAQELGMEVDGVYDYGQEQDFEAAMRLSLSSEADVLICAPSTSDQVEQIWNASLDMEGEGPTLFFSDIAFSPRFVEDMRFDFMQGATPCADPESAFEIAYRVHTGKNPSANEPHIFDALTLAALAIAAIDNGDYDKMNAAIAALTAPADSDGTAKPDLLAWTDEGMGAALRAIRNHQMGYNLNGASGSLDFDKELKTCVVRSTYAHWMVYNGRVLTLSYLSSDGSRRTEANLASWNWTPSVVENFDPTASFSYPAKTGNWALLVAASESWKNYRHQADVLDLYQMLRHNGYDDDHIVLVMEDDIALNPQNTNPGHIASYDNRELYDDVHIDYRLDQISADDIELILSGQRSARLPAVIEAGATDNVLVFWSGHGNQKSLLMGERDASEGLTDDRMSRLLRTVSGRRCYRKMLWLIEACYSASVAVAVEAEKTPGVLMITAANAFETSKADMKIDGVYRTNRFTMLLTSSLLNNPAISYRDLYYGLSRHTMGSHVTVLGANTFDNLFVSSPYEFFYP